MAKMVHYHFPSNSTFDIFASGIYQP